MDARFRARRHAVDQIVQRAEDWAEKQADVRAMAVVGSYAYGRPRMGSDVDLVVLSDDLGRHLREQTFIRSITPGGRLIRSKQWGPMHERRVRLRSGLLVEFGLTEPAWAGLPLDGGTAKVITDGCRIVVDDGRLSRALGSIGRPVVPWTPTA
jgi:nucleotidyltransferase-like protein